MKQQQDIYRVLIFDVEGDYAHFRRFYTTTSPLTFPIPPRTALCGLLGAILGLEKRDNQYLKDFPTNKAFIGLRLLEPIKKVRIAENLIDTKTAKGIGMNLIERHTQINFEFIKDPKYRIYFYHIVGEIYRQMEENLKYHKSIYTPCLGLSENIANFEFVGEFKVEPKNSDNDFVEINSILPAEKTLTEGGIKFDMGSEYFSVRIPIELNVDRVVTKYSDILFERNGKPIKAKMVEPYWEVRYENGARENFIFIE